MCRAAAVDVRCRGRGRVERDPVKQLTEAGGTTRGEWVARYSSDRASFPHLCTGEGVETQDEDDADGSLSPTAPFALDFVRSFFR